MSRVCLVSFSALDRDPRVGRHAALLKESYEVVFAGFAPATRSGVRFVEIREGGRPALERLLAALWLKSGAFERFYWSLPAVRSAQAALAGVNADVFVANDVVTLPVCLAAAGGRPVVLDAHEFAPDENPSFRWRLFYKGLAEYLCRQYLPRAAAMITVSEGIAREYESRYGVKAVVVPNAAAYCELAASPVEPGRVRLVHHGLASPGRQLELMIDLVASLDERFSLDLLLVPADPDYARELAARASRGARVRVLDPCPPERIVETLNRYDMGLYLLPPATFNDRHALPNKFFEFVQARLGIAVGASPEMAAIVRRHELGVVTEDFAPASLAAALSALDASQVAGYKRNADKAARELSFESFAPRYREVIDRCAL